MQLKCDGYFLGSNAVFYGSAQYEEVCVFVSNEISLTHDTTLLSVDHE